MTRTKDFEYLIPSWNAFANKVYMIAQERYDGDEEALIRQVVINMTISTLLAVLGFCNCCLVLKFNWWRAQASVINTIIVCVSYLPFFYTMPDFEYAMFFVVVHILHSLIMWFNTENIFQMLISILIVYAWDLFQLTFRLLGFDG